MLSGSVKNWIGVDGSTPIVASYPPIFNFVLSSRSLEFFWDGGNPLLSRRKPTRAIILRKPVAVAFIAFVFFVVEMDLNEID